MGILLSLRSSLCEMQFVADPIGKEQIAAHPGGMHPEPAIPAPCTTIGSIVTLTFADIEPLDHADHIVWRTSLPPIDIAIAPQGAIALVIDVHHTVQHVAAIIGQDQSCISHLDRTHRRRYDQDRVACMLDKGTHAPTSYSERGRMTRLQLMADFLKEDCVGN